MGAPPSSVGAVHEIVALASPKVAETAVGTAGARAAGASCGEASCWVAASDTGAASWLTAPSGVGDGALLPPPPHAPMSNELTTVDTQSQCVRFMKNPPVLRVPNTAWLHISRPSHSPLRRLWASCACLSPRSANSPYLTSTTSHAARVLHPLRCTCLVTMRYHSHHACRSNAASARS